MDDGPKALKEIMIIAVKLTSEDGPMDCVLDAMDGALDLLRVLHRRPTVDNCRCVEPFV